MIYFLLCLIITILLSALLVIINKNTILVIFIYHVNVKNIVVTIMLDLINKIVNIYNEFMKFYIFNYKK